MIEATETTTTPDAARGKDVSDKDRALECLRRWTAAYVEENPFAMHPLAAREWDRALEKAEEDAFEAGATQDEIEDARAW